MTIVPFSKIEKDPSTLPYHYPSIPVVKYSKLAVEYHYWKAVSILEQAARQNGKLLIPASCIHWKRKKQLQGVLLMVYKRTFYQMSYEELTETEKKKYLELVVVEEATA